MWDLSSAKQTQVGISQLHARDVNDNIQEDTKKKVSSGQCHSFMYHHLTNICHGFKLCVSNQKRPATPLPKVRSENVQKGGRTSIKVTENCTVRKTTFD